MHFLTELSSRQSEYVQGILAAKSLGQKFILCLNNQYIQLKTMNSAIFLYVLK